MERAHVVSATPYGKLYRHLSALLCPSTRRARHTAPQHRLAVDSASPARVTLVSRDSVPGIFRPFGKRGSEERKVPLCCWGTILSANGVRGEYRGAHGPLRRHSARHLASDTLQCVACVRMTKSRDRSTSEARSRCTAAALWDRAPEAPVDAKTRRGLHSRSSASGAVCYWAVSWDGCHGSVRGYFVAATMTKTTAANKPVSVRQSPCSVTRRLNSISP